ncbi:hypothetical protein QR685DRAFT_146425 [Neurospora intermedia]|uniref:Uncharacterized protein n=1 Tax=Neurospora intermedia TaxID=5142 RepID=A0ABR3CZ03_NEUIN
MASSNPHLTSDTPKTRSATFQPWFSNPRLPRPPVFGGAINRGYKHPEARIGNTAASCQPSTPHMVLCYKGLTCFWGSLQKWCGRQSEPTRDSNGRYGMHWNDTPRIRYYQKQCMAITRQFRQEAQKRGSDGDEAVSMM